MKKNKVLYYISLTLGLIFIIIGSVLLIRNISKTSGISEEYIENKRIYSSGDIKVVEDAYDDEFDISYTSPILIRNVEMVQYYKDDKGVRMVLANYPIASFDDYINPEFSNITSKVFYGKSTINNIVLDESILEQLYINDFDSPLTYKQVEDLPIENGDAYNLVYNNGTYVTASDEWQLGDIRVTYYYLDEEQLKDFTIVAGCSDNKLIMDDDSIVLNEYKSINDIKNLLKSNLTLMYISFGLGILFVIVGLLSNRSKY